MQHRNSIGRRSLSIAIGFAVLFLFVSAPSATEEEEEDQGPNRGRLSLTINNDFTTAYFFRGVLNERDGFIWQPSVELSMNLYSGEGAITSVDVGFGIWNSYHSKETLASGSGPDPLYETDYYPSITLTWAEVLETSLIYYWYTSPNGAFRTVEQIDLELAYDDSELLGAFALYPTATFSFELNNTSFGDQEGEYFELALSPGFEFPLDENGDYPLGVTFPLVLGLSMDDYFEDDTGDDTFGYIAPGLDVGVPLAFIPEDFGSWAFTLGVDVFFFGDNLEEANEGDDPYGVWTASVTMDY